jgi:hypothetical protein
VLSFCLLSGLSLDAGGIADALVFNVILNFCLQHRGFGHCACAAAIWETVRTTKKYESEKN